MAILTMSSTTISPALSPWARSKPESYIACEHDFVATTIQCAARVFLAKKEWEFRYVRHIKNEIFRLKEEQKSEAKKSRKKRVLRQKIITIQTLARGYVVRKRYRESDKLLRGSNDAGFSLMESVRKRMDIRQRIASLRQQISEVREARNTFGDSGDDEDDREGVSVSRVEELKATQHKLNINIKTLEAVTKPLQEKFEGLRAEHEKLEKKHGKIESKNASRKYSNEVKAALLAKKQTAIENTRDELTLALSGEGIEIVCKERAKAQQRLDTLVETSSAYARLGMNERDAAAFADDVGRIGKDAHRNAKLYKDSLRSHVASSNLSWSSKSLTSNTVDTTAAVASQAQGKIPRMQKATSASLLLSSDGAVRPIKRGHGRVLKNLLRDRSASSESEQNHSLSPTLKRQDGSFSSTSSTDENHQSKMLRKGWWNIDKRESTPSPTKPRGSANNNLVITNKIKFKNNTTTTATPKITEKRKANINITPKTSNTHTTKVSNRETPKITNVTGKNSMRRTYSEDNTSVSEMKKGLRKVLSERTMLGESSPSSRRVSKLMEELWDECKSRDTRSKSQEPKKLKSKKKDNGRRPRKGSNSRSTSPKHSRSRSHSQSHGRNHRRRGHSNNPRSKSNGRGNREDKGHSKVDRQLCPVGIQKDEYNYNEEDQFDQPKRHISLTTPKIEVLRKNSRRPNFCRTPSLTESSKNRRKFVDDCIDSDGMMPHLP